MKRLFLAALTTLLIAAALAAAISSDAGYVLIAFGNYTLETTAWVGLALLLATLIAMYVLAMLLHGSWRHGSRLARWRGDRSNRQSRRQTARGLLALSEGQFARALHLLDRAAAKAEDPVLNHLMAARASAALNDSEQTQRYLHRAERSGAHPLAVALTQAELLLNQRQFAAATTALQRVRREGRRNPLLLRLLQQSLLGQGNWAELLQLLPDLRRYHALPEADCDALETRITTGLLADSTSADTLQQRWTELPKAMQRRSDNVYVYANALLQAGAAAKAEACLRTQFKRDWSDALVDLYGRCAGDNPGQQLATAETWLAQHPDNAILLRCLGRLALRNQLWGKARDYFESSLRRDNAPETSAELGRLLAHLGQSQRSADYFESGLLTSIGDLPAATLPSTTERPR